MPPATISATTALLYVSADIRILEHLAPQLQFRGDEFAQAFRRGDHAAGGRQQKRKPSDGALATRP